jgi:glutamyl-tRNA synthetase
VRVAITGRRVGPPLFGSIELLGRDRTLGRLARARATAARGDETGSQG